MAKKPKAGLTADEMFGPPPVMGAVVEGKRTTKINASTIMEAKSRARAENTSDVQVANKPGQPGNTFGRWRPGESGNPNGRPKSTDEMKKRFQSMTDIAGDIIELKVTLQRLRLQKAMDILSTPNATLEDFQLAVEVIEGTDMDAVQAILDRGHGKPQQKIDVDHRHQFDDLNPDEFDSWLVDTGQKVFELMTKRRNQKAIEHGQREPPARTDRARKT